MVWFVFPRLFDHSAVDFLETLDCPIYKIASFEITDIPLISYVASKGKPIIISTGIAQHEDIYLAVEACKKQGNLDITLLKCTSSYPAPIEEANISLMQQIAKDFQVKVGLSDHTMGSTLPIIATALGASVIEKHFILDRSIGGPDASFSMNEREFSEMVQQIRDTEKSIGSKNYKLSKKQEEAKAFSRSLYISKEIKKRRNSKQRKY